jgi:hypothetical protein
MKDSSMKIIMTLLVLTCFATTMFAIDTNWQRSGTQPPMPALPFETKKNLEVKSIEVTISMLDASLKSMTSLATVSPETAQATTDFINDLKVTLTGYKTQVSGATTQTELDTINAQMKTELNAKSAEYQQQMKDAVKVFANDAYEKSLQYIQVAQTTLDIYKLKCPSQITAINSIQTNLDALTVEAGKLNTAIQASDATTMKAEMKKVSTLMATIAQQMSALDTAVSQSTDPKCSLS